MAVDGLSHHGDGRHPDGTLLRRICEACVDSIPVGGAAISVMTPGGHRGVVSATDDTSRQMEDVQFTLGDGPSVLAFRSGQSALVADLAGDRRWPLFAEAVAHLGVAAVFAVPLRLGAAALGTLTLYRRESGPLDGRQLGSVLRLADLAAFALLDLLGGIARNDDGVADVGASGPDVADPDYFRSEVYQAAGMVMAQLGISIEAAMVRLRAYAFATGRPSSVVAGEIVRRDLRLEADNE